MQIAPSILSVLNKDLTSILNKVESSGIKYIHLDVMDNIFVPNKTFDDCLIKKLRKKSNLIFDTHLMIEKPELFVENYIDAGSDIITFHLEATTSPNFVIETIHRANKKVGISIKPKTPVEELIPYLNYVDLVLIMSVEPGFGGQAFMADMLEKVKWLKKYQKENNKNFLIEIDGGINQTNYNLCKKVGCDIVVIGTYFFKDDNYEKTIKELEQYENNNCC